MYLIDRTPTHKGAHVVELNNGHGLYSDEVKLYKAEDRERWVRGAKACCADVDCAQALEALQTLDFVATQDPTVGHGDADEAEDGPESQATMLVRLAAAWELFHDHAGDAYVTFTGTRNERQTHRLNTKAVRERLQYLYYAENGQATRAQAVQDALGVLAGRAKFEGAAHEVHVRIAGHAGDIYLDLCDDEWRAVKITRSGWAIVPSVDVPVKFRRSRGMLPLPAPARGGTVDELRAFVNAKDPRAWVLIVAWLVGAFRPRGPYPILNVHGEQGSAKSTTLRVLRSLIDPSSAPLRSQPREERDLLIAATNGWIVALDNVSEIKPWLSDAMCRLATGGGFSTRELYSDLEQTLIDAQRPCATDGIEEYGTRPDYLDRSVIVTLPRIPDAERRPEGAFWHDVEQARPRILGGLLDAVAAALRNEAGVALDGLPRMADFALWVTAAEPALGWKDGTFVDAYSANRSAMNDLALDASVLAGPLRTFVEETGSWQGTATELVQALDAHADEATRSRRAKQREWPKTGHELSGALRRLVPNLRAAGVDVTFDRKNKRRRITLAWTPLPAPVGGTEGENSVTCVTERESASPGASPSGAGASPDEGVRHPFRAWGDAGDAGDAEMGAFSAWGTEQDETAQTVAAGACSDCGAPIARAYGRCAECRERAYAELEMEYPL
jgi:hypothetical protein